MADTPALPAERLDELARQDFLREAVVSDLRAGRYGGRVVTRFPPEPNGYMHIGHAKAVVVDFGIARDFGGRCHLRMDDTNPSTESMEYAAALQEDVRWLGFDWGEHLYFASDMYGRMYELAEGLVRKGHAYVDEQGLETIREQRGTVTEPGTDSPFRDRPAEESLARFREMKAGKHPEGSMVLRAKIDMAAPNMLLRDPVIYRIKHHHHYRTGDEWCVYPMYDFAHCLEDALEGVTHSFCTLEFQDNRALYDWFIEKTGVVPAARAPKQYEMARLEVEYIITSKRRLRQLVEEGVVSGWDDPRMPTIAALRRRGVPPHAIVRFCEELGVAKTNSRVEYARLEHVIRDVLNHEAPRRMGVLEPLEVVIDNWEALGETDETVAAPDFPRDIGKAGDRPMPLGGRVLIERSDFQLEPEPGFKRMAPGRVIRLRHGHVVECTGVEQDDAGAVTRVHVRAFPGVVRGRAPEGVKVRATIHWVSADRAVPAEFRLYDVLFTTPTPLSDPHGRPFHELLNPESLVVKHGVVEPALAGAAVGDRVQLERTGYFAVDPDTRPGHLVLNQTVALKDSWGRRAAAEPEAPAPSQASSTGSTGSTDDDRRRRKKRPASELRAEARAEDPALQAAMDRMLGLGVGEEEADVLSGDTASVTFFEEAVAACPDDPAAVATFIVHELRGAMAGEDLSALPFRGGPLGRLVHLLAADTITSRAGKTVLEVMLAEGGEPGEIVEARGLRAISDEDAVGALVDEVLAAHPDEVARFRAGEKKLQGFFMGQVMRATRGKADPQVARGVLLDKLRG